jgi:hypothetical protein
VRSCFTPTLRWGCFAAPSRTPPVRSGCSDRPAVSSASRTDSAWNGLNCGPPTHSRELTKDQAPRTIEQRQQQLVDLLLNAKRPNTNPPVAALATSAQAEARKALKSVTYVGIVRRAGELTPVVGSTLTEAVWRICSAFGHADTSATLGLLTAEAMEQAQPGIKLIHISANVRLLYVATLVAYLMTEQAFKLLQERTEAPY